MQNTRYRCALNGWVRVLTMVIALAALGGIAHGQVTLYVDDDAPIGGDGSSWGTAMDSLQAALDAAAGPSFGINEIRVGQGRYVPTQRTDPTDPRSATFQLVNGIALKGGYAGLGAKDPDAHDPDNFPSVLSGDINGDDQPDFVNNGENVYHVITGSGTDSSTVLDGFEVTAGNSNKPPAQLNGQGAGMVNVNGGPTISHCTFVANWASWGGGIFNKNASPTVQGCTFSMNFGSGMVSDGLCSVSVTSCFFTENTAGGMSDGGGLLCEWVVSATIANSVFLNNDAGGPGGGLRCSASSNVDVHDCNFVGNSSIAGGGADVVSISTSAITIARCLFQDNWGEYAGGGLICSGAPINIQDCSFVSNTTDFIGGGAVLGVATVTNCAFSRNSSVEPGGGLAFATIGGGITVINSSFSGNSGGAIGSQNGTAVIRNCVLWGNGAALSGVNATVDFTDIQGGWTGPGSNNINLDPLFIQPGCDNLRLAYGSPCIDMGNNAYVPAGVITDLAGNVRIQNGTVDMGAYEGPYDMLPQAACEDNLDNGYTVKLMPTGGAFNPVQKTALVFTNLNGPDNAWVTVTQIDSALHPGAGGFSEMGSILNVDTSLANGDLYTRIYIPFDQATLNGFDWTSVDLTYFDSKTGDWVLAPAANTQNSPDHDGPIGDRIVVEGTNFNTAVTGDLGDYGVFWNPSLQKGFAWANVDHASDFAFGVPLPQCIGDCTFPSDGVVNFSDLTTVLDNWGIAPAGPASFADINHDGVVSVDDLVAVLNHWGACP